MKKILIFFMCTIIFPLTLYANDMLVLQKAFQMASKKASPSLVQLEISAVPGRIKRPPRSFRHAGAGIVRGSGNLSILKTRTVTGLAIGDEGLIFTDTSHLAGKITKIQVHVGEKTYLAKVLGKDFRYNVALLKVEGVRFSKINWSTSKKLQVGQFVLTMGKGYNSKKASSSFGIISALKRMRGGAIQTDAKVSPENTGGALVDLDGKILGMPVILTRRVGINSGIGFVVPAHILKTLIPLLKKKKIIEPAFLGVAFSSEKNKKGIFIIRVVPRSSAEKGGIQKGDQLLFCNKIAIKDQNHFRTMLMKKFAGDLVVIDLLRKGKKISLSIHLGKRSKRF